MGQIRRALRKRGESGAHYIRDVVEMPKPGTPPTGDKKPAEGGNKPTDKPNKDDFGSGREFGQAVREWAKSRGNRFGADGGGRRPSLSRMRKRAEALRANFRDERRKNRGSV